MTKKSLVDELDEVKERLERAGISTAIIYAPNVPVLFTTLEISEEAIRRRLIKMSEEAFFTVQSPRCPFCGETASAKELLLQDKVVIRHRPGCPREFEEEDTQKNW